MCLHICIYARIYAYMLAYMQIHVHNNNLEARHNVCLPFEKRVKKNAVGGHTWTKCVRPPPQRTHLVRWSPPIFTLFWPINVRLFW